MPPEAETGVATIPSHHSVDDTVSRLRQILEAKGITIFAVVDHSGEAEKAGLRMPNTKLIIFGNPKAGTPLMLASPTIAIDLPLKILIWEDTGAKVWVTYQNPESIATRHGLPPDLMQTLAMAGALADQIAL